MGTKLTNGNILRFAMLACLLMTSCGTEVPFPRCVSGDNFNSNTTIAVTAYYSEGNVDAFKADNGEVGNGSIPGSTKQITRWKDTGLITDGEEIVVKITGAWVPWAKDGEKTSSPVAVNTGIIRPTDLSDEFYDAVVDVSRVCGPFEKTTRKAGSCPALECYHLPPSDEEGKGKYGRPCWMENGYGAYLLFQRPEDGNPNETLDTIEYPKSPTTHLGYEGTDHAAEDYYSSGNKIFDNNCNTIKPERGWKIYVKILDNYYYDNAGGYGLEFKKGVIQGEKSDIFETVRKLVRDELDKAGKIVFTNIVENQSFRTFVLSLATLFILATALSYLLGVVRSSLADLIVRILKIVLVVMLISPNSWDFFHNHLLKLFTKGVDEIIALINGHAINQTFDAKSPFSFMDIMIRDKIFAPVVWEAKARALITADKVSIFALLIIGIAVLFYIGLCLYGFIIYLTAFVGITFLISLMPILFAGILFSRFKSLFDGWLTQCISFSMQAILMFTLIAMFGPLIMHYYHRIFGFTACYNEWVHAKIYVLGIKIIDQKYYEWTPGQEYDPIVIRIGGIDDQEHPGIARYRFTGGGSVIKVPPDYKDEDFRYVDLPFLDPDTTTSAPPGGVSLKNEKGQFRRIAELTNSLVAAERSVGIARLTGYIEKELESLQKGGSVTADNKQKFSNILNDSQYGNEKTRWDNKKLKDALINNLTSSIIAGNANPSTPYTELEKQYDYSIIKSIRQGYIVMWPEVFGLILVAFLVWQMRAFVQSVAVVLSGGGMMSTTIASMYDEGFARIFSKMPVLGRAIEMADYGVDSLRVMARARIEGVASAVVKAPEKMLGRVPVVGGAMETVIRGVRGVASSVTSPHDEAEMYSMRSISPDFDYARAWMGAHLGFSPLDALKYMGSYAVGSPTGGLMHNIKHDREALISNLRTLTKGVDKYKPSPYVASEKEDEGDVFTPREGNMGFAQANVRDVFGGDFDHGMGGATSSRMQELFDASGNIHVHAENFDTAVNTLHGLTVMRKNASDSRALQKIDHDIDVLKDAITRMALEHRGELPAYMQEFVTSDGVDFSGLMITGAMHRLRQSAENQDERSGSGSDTESLELRARDMEDTSLLIGTNEGAVNLEHMVESGQVSDHITTNEFRFDVPADTEGVTESGAPHPNLVDEQARVLEEAHRTHTSAFDEAVMTEDMGGGVAPEGVVAAHVTEDTGLTREEDASA
ncbi:TrbL/VirB6 family protein, partial [Anaplasma bovis]|uniref:type IV secretion system protein n=1 Tax=Anaplasma bovis TaxID=186733 RepID=UPI002FF3A515